MKHLLVPVGKSINPDLPKSRRCSSMMRLPWLRLLRLFRPRCVPCYTHTHKHTHTHIYMCIVAAQDRTTRISPTQKRAGNLTFLLATPCSLLC